jgi:glycosyltransferase involved in cell wall biosynthesis
LRIAFADFSNQRFDACTVDRKALGGTESAQCYLSRAMARRGHDVFLIGNVGTASVHDGVSCLNLTDLADFVRGTLDAVVCTGVPSSAAGFRPFLRPGGRVVSWVPHTAEQPAVEYLRNAADRAPYDGMAFVSQWQLDDFVHTFGVEVERAAIMRNGIGFAFEGLFGSAESIIAAKTWPPVLAYTSAPFRGLDVLLEAFPLIRAQVPGAVLRVYSSMVTYQTADETDQAMYGHLYQRCRQTKGVEYIGGLPQPQLARAMKEVSVLTYPNIFAETSCIAAMEAMAAGCRIVTTDFGALPETTAGYARLIPRGRSRAEFAARFVEETIAAIMERQTDASSTEAFLRRQVRCVNETMTWHARAIGWGQWLSPGESNAR